MRKIVEGFLRFQREEFASSKEFYEGLASGQEPKALFITCSDSRIVPNLITHTLPGELFICRNAGNIVPPYGDAQGGVSATIEYAVDALRVPHVIICGHSHCGAMTAVLHPEKVAKMKVVSHWLGHAETARRLANENYEAADEAELLKIVTFENVLAQIDHIMTHPAVATAVSAGRLGIHGWVYDFDTGVIHAFDVTKGQFVQLEDASNIPEATPVRPRSVFAVQTIG